MSMPVGIDECCEDGGVAILEEMIERCQKIRNGEDETVKPGQPVYVNTAWAAHDAVRQGDLAIEVIGEYGTDGMSLIPEGYVEAKLGRQPGEFFGQLVPGNTEGAKHALQHMSGVKVYLPGVWNEEVLQGPYLVLTENNVVLHPTHGHVHLPAGMSFLCSYEREYDKELEAERRARD